MTSENNISNNENTEAKDEETEASIVEETGFN